MHAVGFSFLTVSRKHRMHGREGFFDRTTQRSRPRVLDQKSSEDYFAFVLVGTCVCKDCFDVLWV